MKRTLVRKTPLKARPAPKRPPAPLPGPEAPRKPLPKKNPARAAAAFQRAYGGKERVEWVKSLGCVICGGSPCDAAHVKSGGMGRKADARWTVPLCRTHHDEVHQRGQRSFEARHDVYLDFAAEICDARWEQYVASQPKPETP